MPAKSKAQQMAAGIALAVKKGEKPEAELKGAAKSMYESMSNEQLEEFQVDASRHWLPSRDASFSVRSSRRRFWRPSRDGPRVLVHAAGVAGAPLPRAYSTLPTRKRRVEQLHDCGDDLVARHAR
jgi:hypothetical protein